MKKLLLLAMLLSVKLVFAQCVVSPSYQLTYKSTDGAGNCTFTFQPVVTVNQTGAAVKLARFTFTSGSTSVLVCYSGNPVAIVDCNGSFTDLPSGANQTFPAATIVVPCASTNIVLTGSTSGQGNNTCTTQSVFNGPLPVKLLSFTGASKPNGIQLNWATELESQNEGFSIQKSSDAKAFESIGSAKGQFTTNQLSTYDFLDKNVLADKTYYYRLKQNDVDGTSAYSKIIAVRYTPDQASEATIFPNATSTGRFMLSMPKAQTAILKLYNTAGVDIPVNVDKTDDPNLVSISPIHALPKGIYVLQASFEGLNYKKTINVMVQ